MFLYVCMTEFVYMYLYTHLYACSSDTYKLVDKDECGMMTTDWWCCCRWWLRWRGVAWKQLPSASFTYHCHLVCITDFCSKCFVGILVASSWIRSALIGHFTNCSMGLPMHLRCVREYQERVSLIFTHVLEKDSFLFAAVNILKLL